MTQTFRRIQQLLVGPSDYVASQPEELARPGFGVQPEFDPDLVWQWGLSKPVIGAINGARAGIAVAPAGFL